MFVPSGVQAEATRVVADGRPTHALWSRHYDPTVGRFTSIDPADSTYDDPGQLMRYGYVHNDPINYTDPSGMFEGLAGMAGRLAIGGAIATIGGVAGVYATGRTPLDRRVAGVYTARALRTLLLGLVNPWAGAGMWLYNYTNDTVRIQDDGSLAADTRQVRREWMALHAVRSGATAGGDWVSCDVDDPVDLRSVYRGELLSASNWWISGLHGLRGGGRFEARVVRRDGDSASVELRNVKMGWLAMDRTQGKSWLDFTELRGNNLVKWGVEGGVDFFGDNLLSADFKLLVPFTDDTEEVTRVIVAFREWR